MSRSPPVHVSDTTAVTNLAAVGRLDLMQHIFGRIVIPEAVFRELTDHGDQIPGAVAARTASWIEIRPVVDHGLVGRLQQSLDLGESEAIALAVEAKAATLIIDEHAGRQIAQALAIPIIGVLGILIEAKRRHLIDSVAVLLARLRQEAGFRVSAAMTDRVLREVGER